MSFLLGIMLKRTWMLQTCKLTKHLLFYPLICWWSVNEAHSISSTWLPHSPLNSYGSSQGVPFHRTAWNPVKVLFFTWAVRREEKMTQWLEKGKHIFKQFSLIKVLGNNSSNWWWQGWREGQECSTLHNISLSQRWIISLCRSVVLHYLLINEIGVGVQTLTHNEIQTTGAFLPEIRQADSGACDEACYECQPNAECGRNTNGRSLTF